MTTENESSGTGFSDFNMAIFSHKRFSLSINVTVLTVSWDVRILYTHVLEHY
jgi:hypothetical protein